MPRKSIRTGQSLTSTKIENAEKVFGTYPELELQISFILDMIIRIAAALIAAALIAAALIAAATAAIVALIGSISVPGTSEGFEPLLQYLSWRPC
jgi:hypothetical protein